MGDINFIRKLEVHSKVPITSLYLASYHVNGYLGEYWFLCIPLAFTFPSNLFRELLSMVEEKVVL